MSRTKLTLTVEVTPPTVPNFLLIEGRSDSEKVSIADISDDDLRKIGVEWTERLIARARAIRMDRSEDIT